MNEHLFFHFPVAQPYHYFIVFVKVCQVQQLE